MLAEEEQKRLQDVLNGGPIVDLLAFRALHSKPAKVMLHHREGTLIQGRGAFVLVRLHRFEK